jgi:antitoxin HicB
MIIKNKALNFVNIYNILGENNMKYRVIIEQDEDGVFVAECPSLPGTVSQGKTREEAIINITDAIKGYLESLKKSNEPIPSPISEEIIEIYG